MQDLWNNLIMQPLGLLINAIYLIVHDYASTIIIFTVLTRLLLFPLAYKQQKSMKELQKVQPLMAGLQAKYKNDKEKLNAEMVKLYSEHKVNPLGSCLPTLLQIPLFLAMYQVIIAPVTYILQRHDLVLQAHSVDKTISEIQIAINQHLIDFHLFGWSFFDMAGQPSFQHVSQLWLFPIVAGLTTFLSSKLMSKYNQAAPAANDQSAQMMKSMNNIFPIMMAFICFSVPTGLSFYWIISNSVMIVQQMYLAKHFNQKFGEKEAKKS